ncbi:hypothetical protein CAOG_010039 [Capsaspora owczarzaki ATCC 30864]|uniref:LysM domain-containing protein n=2 Tax=Capsaspora owczarzaki (strain ATCC 30864) TaxID=595528 RepID=A0A0D2WV79_CAPO3|nr:hypothetical protein CAOG_010039 [Capsaspora owczarzaki ATCC 30864]
MRPALRPTGNPTRGPAALSGVVVHNAHNRPAGISIVASSGAGQELLVAASSNFQHPSNNRASDHDEEDSYSTGSFNDGDDDDDARASASASAGVKRDRVVWTRDPSDRRNRLLPLVPRTVGEDEYYDQEEEDQDFARELEAQDQDQDQDGHDREFLRQGPFKRSGENDKKSLERIALLPARQSNQQALPSKRLAAKEAAASLATTTLGSTASRLSGPTGAVFGRSAPLSLAGTEVELVRSTRTGIGRRRTTNKDDSDGDEGEDFEPGRDKTYQNATHTLIWHRVTPTDTLQHLAVRFGASVSDIKHVNRIWRVEELSTRRRVRIPVARYNIISEQLHAEGLFVEVHPFERSDDESDDRENQSASEQPPGSRHSHGLTGESTTLNPVAKPVPRSTQVDITSLLNEPLPQIATPSPDDASRLTDAISPEQALAVVQRAEAERARRAWSCCSPIQLAVGVFVIVCLLIPMLFYYEIDIKGFRPG